MNAQVNILNWFEICVTDFVRAKDFYEKVFAIQLHEVDMMGMKMGMFPGENGNGKVSGAIVQGPMHKPSSDGAVIYFNGNPDLAEALNRVEKSGGTVLMPKTFISPDIGYMAFFMDSEGNRVAMHSIG